MIPSLRTLSQVSLQPHQRVIVRADFDVAVGKGSIKDDFRMQEVLFTIKYLMEQKCHIRIISHRGRPHGTPVSLLSMRLVANHLSRLLKKSVIFISDPFDKKTLDMYNSDSRILFFENIRFWSGEEKNNVLFARALAQWGDIYINEAFANSHRIHASMVALPKILPSYAGFRFEKEVRTLEHVIYKPKHPFIAILGGAKLETKVPLIKCFLKNADHVLIGGAIANTLLTMQGLQVGRSFADKKQTTPQWLRDKKLSIPTDVIVSKSMRVSSSLRICNVRDVKHNEYIIDIGPQTVMHFTLLLNSAKTIVWNGPLGYTEIPQFAKGTIHVARHISHLNTFSVVGGGDSVAALHNYKIFNGFTHISTGGGAMLEFLTGKKLSAIEVLAK